MNMRLTCLVTSLLFWPSVGRAQLSTFETGLEGWTLVGSGLLEHDGRGGGNPGGYARFEDAPGQDGDGWLVAPPRFLGDWSRLNDIGVLSWDHRVINSGDVFRFMPAQAQISGPGGTATYTSDDLLGHGWRSFSVAITQSEWTVSGDWRALLQNVKELRIRIEGVQNDGPLLDIDGIDNVSLSAYQPGDLNCDGSIDLTDVEPFITALLDPDEYENKYPDCDITNADINADGSVDLVDIGPFIELLLGP